MKIAVNTRLLLNGKLEGIGWFTYEVFKRIALNHPEHEFYFIFDRPYSELFIFSENVKPIVLPPPTRHPVLWYYWFEYALPNALKKIDADVFLSPDGYLSLSVDLPQVAVIHDINFFHYPKGLPFVKSRYLNHFFPRYAQKACRIVTVSNYSKHDIAKNYNIDLEKIDVAYNGASEQFKPLDDEEKQAARQRYSSGLPYFLFVGALNPRKNVARLIQAFDIFKQTTGLQEKLLLVGEPMFMTSDIKKAYLQSQFKADILFLGRKDVAELSQITGAAKAIVYPSIFEGFGIPLLEAMKCGVPVASSNTTAMPEVAGDAALYFNPMSVDEMAEAMQILSRDNNLCSKLSAAALERQKMFSWDVTADTVFKSIEKCLSQC
ncbi:glycosyltransferase family 4 protein [Tenuifilum thalassicum]|uniref:Glycosyltransferase family 4 protein n=1 Tax=Tenuifilum thalassicum TaxID=2590900 RepID=A0A7D3XWM8_9BACT|nr:glycosyltransferase family 1 protein [Tenuifilum thalassicum]QKG80868.1 glycosyltransferase family 4 protein [Tenuifilum thalassicum]